MNEGRCEGPYAVTDSGLPHKPVLSPGGFCLSPPCCLFQATLLLCFRDSLLMVQTWKFESQAPPAVSCILLLRVALVETFLLIQGVSVEQPRCDLAILVKREVSPWTQRTLSALGQTCLSWTRTRICCRLISSVLAAIFYLCQVLFLH